MWRFELEDLYQRGTFYAKSVRGMNSMKDGKTYNAKTLQPLSNNGKQRLATFSPDATKVAFMRDNNLFIKDLTTGEEKQFTNDGLYNHIINGAPDWVYEEEFSFSQGFYWSPDSKKIAFMKFDESNVREFQMEEFDGLYPDWYSFKYPKAGEDNFIVGIYVYDLASGKTVKMDTGTETDIYLPRIAWAKDANVLAIQRLNRHQNHLEILAADGITKGADVISTAVSVAPVTNWRYYDNVYTERFMRTPQENPDGYDLNSPVHNTALIKGNYLLCHGSGDDNVHYQNAMELIKAMISNGKQFDLMIYPNKNHGIYGGYEYGPGESRMHLFNKIDSFLFKHLLGE